MDGAGCGNRTRVISLGGWNLSHSAKPAMWMPWWAGLVPGQHACAHRPGPAHRGIVELRDELLRSGVSSSAIAGAQASMHLSMRALAAQKAKNPRFLAEASGFGCPGGCWISPLHLNQETVSRGLRLGVDALVTHRVQRRGGMRAAIQRGRKGPQLGLNLSDDRFARCTHDGIAAALERCSSGDS
jgi:hypothetical protein